MYYINPRSDLVPDKFSIYDVEAAGEICDDESNVLIVPEIFTFFLYKFKKIRKIIWWLSVDFYEDYKPLKVVKNRLKARNWPIVLWPVEFAGLVLKRKIHFKYYRFRDKGQFFHLYNCEYVRQYILSHGISEKNTMFMCAPINQVFFENVDLSDEFRRENIVLYNPKKGKDFADKIILRAKDQGVGASFIALQNMSSQEIVDLMKRAKIYMDFGFFPGPDRIPQEAVTLGCNIITSSNGSASNPIDVPIPEEFKFDATEENLDLIIDTIEDMLHSYKEYFPLYDAYREKVKLQVELFNESIDNLISNVLFELS